MMSVFILNTGQSYKPMKDKHNPAEENKWVGTDLFFLQHMVFIYPRNV